MNIKKFSQEVHDSAQSNINTMPVMSLFVLLIPFLLLTTVFVDTAVFQILFPKKSKILPALSSTSEKEEKIVTVFLDKQGILLNDFGTLTRVHSLKELETHLMAIKAENSDRTRIILGCEQDITYEEIIDTMDIMIHTGFDRISLSGA